MPSRVTMYPSMPFCPLMFQGLTEQQKEFIEKQWAQQKEQFLGRQKSMYGSFTFEQTWHLLYYTLFKKKRILRIKYNEGKIIKEKILHVVYDLYEMQGNSKNAEAFYCFSSVYYFTYLRAHLLEQ